VYLFYTDESGRAYKREPVLEALVSPGSTMDPWYALGAVCISERLRPVVDDYFVRMKQAFFPGCDPASEGTEIKGSRLRNYLYLASTGQWARKKPRDGPWATLQASQVRALADAVFDLLRKVKVTVYVAAIDQRRVYEYCRRRGTCMWQSNFHALTLLQQRACQFLEYEQGRSEQGAFILDRHSSLQIERHFMDFLQTRNQINQTAAYPVDFDQLLVEEPLAVDSHVVSLIQLADVITHAVWQGVTKGAGHPWFQAVEPYLVRRWGSETYLGAGLELLPRTLMMPRRRRRGSVR
jgi:hypothetical protein